MHKLTSNQSWEVMNQKFNISTKCNRGKYLSSNVNAFKLPYFSTKENEKGFSKDSVVRITARSMQYCFIYNVQEQSIIVIYTVQLYTGDVNQQLYG